MHDGWGTFFGCCSIRPNSAGTTERQRDTCCHAYRNASHGPVGELSWLAELAAATSICWEAPSPDGSVGWPRPPASRRRPTRSCILLWMNGGPSQTDTFDLKPGTRTAALRPIATRTPGISICEHLPGLAQWSDRLAVIRSMSTREGDHGPATISAPAIFPKVRSSSRYSARWCRRNATANAERPAELRQHFARSGLFGAGHARPVSWVPITPLLLGRSRQRRRSTEAADSAWKISRCRTGVSSPTSRSIGSRFCTGPKRDFSNRRRGSAVSEHRQCVRQSRTPDESGRGQSL